MCPLPFRSLHLIRITAVWIYEKCGWIGRVILTSNPREGVLAVRKSFCSCLMLSNPCGVLLAKEMVPRWALTICATSFRPKPCSDFPSLSWVLAISSPRFNALRNSGTIPTPSSETVQRQCPFFSPTESTILHPCGL